MCKMEILSYIPKIHAILVTLLSKFFFRLFSIFMQYTIHFNVDSSLSHSILRETTNSSLWLQQRMMPNSVFLPMLHFIES